ncbi:MAG: sulfatase-like hydrolase/transferase [Saprospiraceae bacterium]|nr:sulfatase-like hydrolase/transferase [Saprospiraceae bacterium]
MRTLFFLGILTLCYGCAESGKMASTDDRPNIIFLLVDDLGKEWISAYGAEDIETPNIDALAASGILFNNVYSMPQCTPSRLTFLTGQYPFRHGWVNHWDVPRWGGGAHYDDHVNPSLGKEIKKAGYRTCIAGKWQIDDFRVEPNCLSRNGFDSYCMWTGYETGNRPSAERYDDPYIFTRDGAKTYQGEFGPDVFTAHINNFILQQDEDPFFVYYPMVLPHTPLINTPDAGADTDLGKHIAMVKYVDKITGDIVQTLEASGKRDNTVFIWTTDNGSTNKIAGHRRGRLVKGGKARTSEAGVCAPFLVSWPAKTKPNQISNALIDFTDLFPTILDLAGVSIEHHLEHEGNDHYIDGHSFKDALLSPGNESNRQWILSMGGGNNAQLTENGVENQFVFRDRVIRNERYKLYLSAAQEAERFIDLMQDPAETIDLKDSLTTEDRKNNFESLWSVTTSFPAEDSEPKYIPNPAQSWDRKITAESKTWKK